VRLLLDTVAFIMAVKSPERLSRKALRSVQDMGNLRELSVISLTEIATKVGAGKLEFPRGDVLQGIADLQLRLLPCTADHALDLFDLPLHHRDPFDRLIIAQALAENIAVVTCDPQFRLYRGLAVVW
jgi:PIN domain nuclease of toxin-antitoxin system